MSLLKVKDREGWAYVSRGAKGEKGDAWAIESAEHPGCFYLTVEGRTEWVNPPMEPGVEYCTTERYSGQPVYAMYVDCGDILQAQNGLSVPFAPVTEDQDAFYNFLLVGIDGSVLRYLDDYDTQYFNMALCPYISSVAVCRTSNAFYVSVTANTVTEELTSLTLGVIIRYVKDRI